MVWIVDGTLNSDKNDKNDTPVTPSQHYLRPGRTYKVGRMGGVRAEAKPGGTPGAASKPRPYDFRIASLGISKEGLATFTTSAEWEAEDNPDSPSNGAPYPLSVRFNKKFQLSRTDGQELAHAASDVVTVQDGDTFTDPTKKYWFKFTWQPINFCFPSAAVAVKKERLRDGKSLGCKIAFKDYLPHHNYYVPKNALPTANLLQAAVNTAHVVSPSFFTEVVERGAPPPRPTEPLPPHPGPLPPGASKEETAAYDKKVTTWEKQLLGLNEDVGGDWENWWGHSFLEKDWSLAWPNEKEFPPEKAQQAGSMDPKKWMKDERRKSLFEGCLFLGFRAEQQQEDADAIIVKAAGGAYFSCDLLQQDSLPTISDIVRAVDAFKTEHSFNSASKVVIFAPTVGEDDEGSSAQIEILQDLQRVLNVGKLNIGPELAQAVHDVDVSCLFSDVAPPAAAGGRTQESSSHRRTQRTVTQPSQPTQATPPFPTGGVPGTHPDSDQPAASGHMDLDPTPQGGASNSISNSQEDAAPSQPRKLTRRAKTGRNAFDDMFADDDDTVVRTETARSSNRPHTQDFGGAGAATMASTEAGPSLIRMNVEPATPAAGPAPTRHTTLKRRAGQRNALALMFDDSPDRPESSGAGGQTQSMHQDLMRTNMTRQERMAAIEEEDQRLAREEVEQSQSAAAAGTKKRGKSVALASDGSDEDRQPTRKRTEKKGGDAPVSMTNKRSRAASRDPTAAPSSEDDESARTQRKKFKATGKTPAPTAAAPKNAKEVAALRKAEKEAKEKESAKLLQVKVTKRKNASADQAFNEDFNALKIVRPVLKAMPQVEKRRMAWDENDSDVERHDGLVQEDQERLAAQDDDDDMDPENWRKPTQAMFVIKTLDVVRKERQAPRTDVDERWAGMVNYKKFRPKNAPRDPLAQRRQIELVVPESQDLGLGAGYNDRKGTAFSQVQQADDEDDDDELHSVMTKGGRQQTIAFPSLSAKVKKAPAAKKKPAAAKGKGKGKQVVDDSEEEEDELDSDSFRSSTLRANDNDGMDLDDDDSDSGAMNKRSKAATKKKAAATPSTSSSKAKGKAAPRKAPAATIVIDDSDSDSDSGLTFKGFGKKGMRR